MTKNLYYRTFFRRDDILLTAISKLIARFTSFPRLCLEVFIRKNMGVRYFRLWSAISVGLLLLIIPSFIKDLMPRSARQDNFWLHYLTWYIFVALFFAASAKRYLEIKRDPTTFDFTKFSLSSGEILPWFFTIQLTRRKTDYRLIEIFYEPAVFFIAGLLLALIGQRIGFVLILSSVIYSLSYAAAYNNGDNFVLDKIDEMILNQMMEGAFVDGVDDEELRFLYRRPSTPELRRKLLPQMFEEDEVAIAL